MLCPCNQTGSEGKEKDEQIFCLKAKTIAQNRLKCRFLVVDRIIEKLMSSRHKNFADIPDPAMLQKRFHDLGLSLSQQEAKALVVYLKNLLAWNRRINLVGLKDWQSICDRLIVDSWYLARFLCSLNLPAAPDVLDLGAGAGLPGIPLRIFWPKGHYLMVESRQKRSAFLQYVLSQLRLADTRVFPGRVEDLPADMAGADLIVSRAFCPWPELLSLIRSLLNNKGRLIVLANEPSPQKEQCPEDWEVVDYKEYHAADKKRYFWLFAPISASN